MVDVRVAGVLTLPAVEEEPVVVEEVVADVPAVEEGPVAAEEVVADVAAAGEVLDKDVAAGVLQAVVVGSPCGVAAAAPEKGIFALPPSPASSASSAIQKLRESPPPHHRIQIHC